ncbi:hypothetical protein KR093_010115, partial [Drosophila rubida]
MQLLHSYQQMLQRRPMHHVERQEEYVANPLNAFALLRRLQQDWPKWLSYLQDDATRELLRLMQLQLAKAPSALDLKLATEGLLRIESFYDLEASHMAKGLLLQQQYNAHLNPADCMTLGSHLLNRSEYAKSTHWFRTGLRHYKQPYGKLYGQVLGLKRQQLSRAYALAIARERKRLTDQHIPCIITDICTADGDSEQQPRDKQTQEWQQLADSMLNDMVLKASNAKIKKLTNEYLAGDEEIFIKERAKHKPKPTAMQRGCRGLWSKPRPQRLNCSYLHDDTFQRLAPLKLEWLSVQPRILLFHQVLSDSDIAVLRNVSLYSTARDFAKQGAKLFPLSQTHAALQRKVALLLGTASTDLSLHVFNYGLGGYLQRNSKFTCRGAPTNTKSKTVKAQERCHSKHLATMLIYVSDVPLGGATIFTKLQLLVQPKKGNALVWMNRDNDFRPEQLTEHAVCPVVVGSRW